MPLNQTEGFENTNLTMQTPCPAKTSAPLRSPGKPSAIPAACVVSAQALCMSWTSDGQTLAIGTFDGLITIRDRVGTETVRCMLAYAVRRSRQACFHAPCWRGCPGPHRWACHVWHTDISSAEGALCKSTLARASVSDESVL